MVLCGKSGWAVQVPLLLLFVSTVALLGSYLSILDESTWGPIFGALFSLALFAFTLSELRLLQVRGEHLIVRSVYGQKLLPHRSVAFGIRVHHGGRGGPHYTIYAQDGATRIDLAGALTKKGSQALRRRLEQSLLSGRQPSEAAKQSAEVVRKAEATQEAQSQEAAQIVHQYYASGGGKRATLYIGGFVVFYLLAMGVFFALSGALK